MIRAPHNVEMYEPSNGWGSRGGRSVHAPQHVVEACSDQSPVGFCSLFCGSNRIGPMLSNLPGSVGRLGRQVQSCRSFIRTRSVPSLTPLRWAGRTRALHGAALRSRFLNSHIRQQLDCQVSNAAEHLNRLSKIAGFDVQQSDRKGFSSAQIPLDEGAKSV